MSDLQRRPSEAQARRAIEAFLGEELGVVPHFRMIPDGDKDSAANKCGWAFWVLPDDTTSYVHEDLEIEWLGTNWEPESEEAS